MIATWKQKTKTEPTKIVFGFLQGMFLCFSLYNLADLSEKKKKTKKSKEQWRKGEKNSEVLN